MDQSFSRADVLTMLSDLSGRLDYNEVALEEIDAVARAYGLLEPAERDDDEPDVRADED